jgi:hypothetical protein
MLLTSRIAPYNLDGNFVHSCIKRVHLSKTEGTYGKKDMLLFSSKMATALMPKISAAILCEININKENISIVLATKIR